MIPSAVSGVSGGGILDVPGVQVDADSLGAVDTSVLSVTLSTEELVLATR